MTAWVSGFLGLMLSFGIGLLYLHLTLESVALSVLASLVCGMIALFVTVRSGGHAWIRKHIVCNPTTTWAVFLTLYFGGMFAVSPALRDLKTFAWMVLPLIMTTGFTILAYGPIQDRHVIRMQKKS